MNAGGWGQGGERHPVNHMSRGGNRGSGCGQTLQGEGRQMTGLVHSEPSPRESRRGGHVGGERWGGLELP